MSGPERSSWQCLSVVLVRASGFSFARLEGLRFPRSLAAIEGIVEAARDRAACGHAFDRALADWRFRDQPELDDNATRKQLSRHVKRVRAFARGEGADWPADSFAEIGRRVPALAELAHLLHEKHQQQHDAMVRLEEEFGGELETRRAVLRDTFGRDERLREAVFLESPEALERIAQLLSSGGRRDARARQRERLAIMYLQRFCAKNDTNSFCGPHAISWFEDGEVDPRLEIETGEVRRTYFSHWAAQTLLVAAVRRTASWDVHPVRLHPTVQIDGARVTWCAIQHDATVVFRRSYRRTTLPERALALVLLLHARGPCTWPALQALAESEAGLAQDELAALVDELVEAGIVLRGLAVPAGLFHPLRWVREVADGWPDGEVRSWLIERVEALARLLGGFSSASLEERVAIYRQMVDEFQHATGDRGVRGEGQHYADRMLVHEDCHVRVQTALGDETRRVLLEGLVPLVNAAALPLELARERVREWFRARFGCERRVPVMEAHRAFDEERPTERPSSTELASSIEASMIQVRACFEHATTSDGSVRITAASLARAVGPRFARPGYLSVDLMLARMPDTTIVPVLGEAHGFCWLPTCLLDVVPEPDRARVVLEMRQALRRLSEPHTSVECLFAHTQATDRRVPLTDADLVLVDFNSDRDSIPFGRLEVVLAGSRFHFLDGDREIVPVTTYTTYPFLLYTSPVAPSIDDFVGRFFPDSLLPERLRYGDCPRMFVGDLIFRRQTWRRPVMQLQTMFENRRDAALFRAAQELRNALGAPATVFVAFPNEPKPVFLDFENYFLVEAFAHLIARQPSDQTVRLAEMLPAPNSLLARGPDGPRTSELRLGLFRTGPRSVSG
jgi:hypothetical protein